MAIGNTYLKWSTYIIRSLLRSPEDLKTQFWSSLMQVIKGAFSPLRLKMGNKLDFERIIGLINDEPTKKFPI